MRHAHIPHGFELRLRRFWQRAEDWLLRDDQAIDDGLVIFLLLGWALTVLS